MAGRRDAFDRAEDDDMVAVTTCRRAGDDGGYHAAVRRDRAAPHMDGAEGELAPRRNRPELVSETMRATRAALDWWEVLAVRGIDDPGREIDMPLPEHGGEQDDRR